MEMFSALVQSHVVTFFVIARMTFTVSISSHFDHDMCVIFVAHVNQ